MWHPDNGACLRWRARCCCTASLSVCWRRVLKVRHRPGLWRFRWNWSPHSRCQSLWPKRPRRRCLRRRLPRSRKSLRARENKRQLQRLKPFPRHQRQSANAMRCPRKTPCRRPWHRQAAVRAGRQAEKRRRREVLPPTHQAPHPQAKARIPRRFLPPTISAIRVRLIRHWHDVAGKRGRCCCACWFRLLAVLHSLSCSSPRAALFSTKQHRLPFVNGNLFRRSAVGWPWKAGCWCRLFSGWSSA